MCVEYFKYIQDGCCMEVSTLLRAESPVLQGNSVDRTFIRARKVIFCRECVEWEPANERQLILLSRSSS